MIKQKLEGEKLKEVRAGDSFCCWGGSGNGCDCTLGSKKFGPISDVWIDRMEVNQVS